MRAFVFLCIAFGVFAFGAAAAKENYKENGVKADTKEAFDPLAAKIREELQDGGRYEYVKPAERKTIEQKLTDMSTLFDQTASVSSMNQDQKIALFNDQEVVNSILTQRDRDRVICKKVTPIGSHIPVTNCHTYGQEVEAHEGTQKQMADWKNSNCVGDNAACASR